MSGYRYLIECRTCGASTECGENHQYVFIDSRSVDFAREHDAKHSLREGERVLTHAEHMTWGNCDVCHATVGNLCVPLRPDKQPRAGGSVTDPPSVARLRAMHAKATEMPAPECETCELLRRYDAALAALAAIADKDCRCTPDVLPGNCPNRIARAALQEGAE